MAYERRYNYNKIHDKFLMRTTYYGQKGSEEMVQQNEDNMNAFYNGRDGLWMLAQLE